ncbi:hypothetical protein M5689_025195 [Euphorbia peplus]|nr:hypothetical protein M5689_025195 [Euphorbia peplus]
MGKRTSKKDDKQKLKFQENLRKVLKPQVFITDISAFKNLVQELTGNYQTSFNQVQEYSDCTSGSSLECSSGDGDRELEEMSMDLTIEEELDLLAVREIESWLLDLY